MTTPTLQVTVPATLGPDQLYATDVPETEYADWVAGTTYALAARVIRTTRCGRAWLRAIWATTRKPPAQSTGRGCRRPTAGRRSELEQQTYGAGDLDVLRVRPCGGAHRPFMCWGSSVHPRCASA